MPSGGNEPGGRIENTALLKWFRLAILALALIGLFNVYSSTFYMNIETGTTPYFHTMRHIGYLCTGIVGMMACQTISLERLRRFLGPICLAICFLFVLVWAAGPVINGAQRWIRIFGISIQPSEFAKVAAVLWTASCLAERVRHGRPVTFLSEAVCWLRKMPCRGKVPTGSDAAGAYVPLAFPAVFSLFVFLQPDMGTSVLILAFPVALYMLCGVPGKDIAVSLLLAGAAGAAMILFSPYRLERVRVMYDPFQYAADQGYQVVQSLIAVGSGGFWGQGIGEGLSKFLYLPEQYTDFAFAVLSQELGFLASGFVLFLFAVVLALGFRMAGDIPRLYPALIVYGLTMLISVEGFLNIAMVIGIFPVTGVPLPFISFGGTSLVSNLCAVGLISNAVKYGEKMRARDEREQKLKALAGEPVSLQKISGAVFRPPAGEWMNRH